MLKPLNAVWPLCQIGLQKMSESNDFLQTERYFHGPLAQKRIAKILEGCSHEEERLLKDLHQSHEELLWELNRFKLLQENAAYEKGLQARTKAATYMTPERELVVVTIARRNREWPDSRRASNTLKVLTRWARRFDPEFFKDVGLRDPEEVKRRIRDVLKKRFPKKAVEPSSTD